MEMNTVHAIPLTTLFASATLQMLGNDRPLLGAVL